MEHDKGGTSQSSSSSSSFSFSSLTTTNHGWGMIAAGAAVVAAGAAAAVWFASSPSAPSAPEKPAPTKADEKPQKSQPPEPATAPPPSVPVTRTRKPSSTPHRPTSADLAQALSILEDGDKRTKWEVWQACSILSILSAHDKVRKFVLSEGNGRAVEHLIEMMRSDDPLDSFAACDLMFILINSSKPLRDKVCRSGVVDAVIRLLCREVALALTNDSRDADSDVDVAAGDARAMELTRLPKTLLAGVAGGSNLTISHAVSSKTMAELAEESIGAAAFAGGDEDPPVSASEVTCTGTIRAVAIRRHLAFLTNLTAADDAGAVVLRAAHRHEAGGGVALFSALCSLNQAPPVQLGVLQLLSNLTSDATSGRLSSAVLDPEDEQGAGASSSSSSSSPSSSLAGLLSRVYVPLVACLRMEGGGLGYWKPVHMMRIVNIIGSLLSPLMTSSRSSPRTSLKGETTPDMDLKPLAKAVLDAGAVKVLCDCLVACSDYKSSISQRAQAIGQPTAMSPALQRQLAAASEGAQRAMQVLRALTDHVPGVQEEVEAAAKGLARLAAHSK